MKKRVKYLLAFIMAIAFCNSCQPDKLEQHEQKKVMPSMICSSSIDGYCDSMRFFYNRAGQITKIILADSAETTFEYAGNKIMSIYKKSRGDTRAFTQAEFIYDKSKLRQIITYISTSPCTINISKNESDNMYTASVNSDEYQFQYDDIQDLISHNSAIMDHAKVNCVADLAGPFIHARIPMGLRLYYSFYDQCSSFLFFNKKLVRSVEYTTLNQVSNYTYSKNSEGLVQEVIITEGKMDVEKIKIIY